MRAGRVPGDRRGYVSNTLTNPEWKNSTVISGDVMQQLSELKAQPGKNINITGSGTLVESLLQNRLLDELHLLVHLLVPLSP